MRKSPYSIVEKKQFIGISEREYSIMACGTSSKNEKDAIKLIENKWCEGEDEEADFGIEIPTLGGWSGPEALKLDVGAAQQREAVAKAQELFAEVAETMGITIKEASKLVSGYVEGSPVPEELLECADALNAFNDRQRAIDFPLLRHTVLLKRVFSTWTQDLTLALPTSVRNSLEAMAEREDMGYEDETETAPKEAPAPSPNLELLPDPSENIDLQTGVA